MLNVTRLQLLREVARRGTIAAAASAMSLTPSAVSQQLGILEQEVGAALLERFGRSVRLTDTGRLLVRHADQIMRAIAAAEVDLAATRHVVTGEFRVAAIPTAARALMPAAMSMLSRHYPALRITLRDLEMAESLAGLKLGEIDLAVVDEYESLKVRHDDQHERHLLVDEALYVALPPGHRLADRKFSLYELRDEYWIMDSERSQFFRMVLSACRANGVEPRIRSQCKDFGVILALVEANLGVALVPGLALHDRPVRAVVRPTNPPLRRDVVALISVEYRTHPAVVSILQELDAVAHSFPSGPARRRTATFA